MKHLGIPSTQSSISQRGPRGVGIALITFAALSFILAPSSVTFAAPLASARAQPIPRPWRLASKTVRVVGHTTGLFITRDGDEIAAYDVARGDKRWSARIAHLRAGPRGVAVDAHGIYALGRTSLFVIASKDGAILHTEALKDPREIMTRGGSIYIALGQGVLRYAAGGQKRLTKSTKFSGALRGADGDVVLLYRELDGKRHAIHGSPRRLTVVDLKQNKMLYEFRLLRDGAHRLVRIGGGRLSFLDYSQLHEGKNPRKLYFTKADYQEKKKLRDLSLKHHYADAKADHFFVHAIGQERLILIQTGEGATSSTLLYLDLAARRVRWKVTLAQKLGAPFLRKDRVWISAGGPTPKILAYALSTGKRLTALTLGSPALGRLHDAGPGRLLVRQANGLMVLKTDATPTSRPAILPSTSQPTVTASWRLYRDRLAGYTIKLPKTWRFDPKRIRHFGQRSFAVPFVRYETQKGRWRVVASLHLLVRPARGQKVDALWKAVLTQRRRRAKKATVIQVKRGNRQGNPQILGSYRFRNRFGEFETAKSLCLIAHGLAFEIRVRVRPTTGTRLDAEISKILDTLTLKPPKTKKVR